MFDKSAKSYSQAEAQCPGHVGLPVGAEEHKHPDETTEERPVGVESYSTGNACSHSNKHCRKTEKNTG